tara:strand:+ start:4226 stop:5830 length:1605 start_codon:yes stop_codon:yes gene_type:complete
MTVFVRGSNPVWLLDDLVGNLLDDTYYMFVLQNDLPYLPATVYDDPSATIPLANPIQFLANGTLPVDVFFDPDVVYRLEIRQGNTQSDALIYLIEDYSPGAAGTSPVTNFAFPTDNQITNPQFSLINFSSPYTLTNVTNPDPIEFAPGWFLNLAGTGNVTFTRVALDNASANDTNAPYAMEIDLTGAWTGTPYVSQRFNQNGMLWSNLYVSSAVMAKVDGAAIAISASLFDSNGTELVSVLDSIVISTDFEEYKDNGLVPATTNPDVPPSAWIEYRLFIPLTVDIFLSSFQLIASTLDVEYSYSQDTVERQIDNTYHTAQPIMPVGAVIDYFGFAIPEHYLNCNGDAKDRTNFLQLFNALTLIETVALTSGVDTFTVVSSTDLWIGMAIEGAGVATSATISAISGTTVTMSAVATATSNAAVTFFAFGAGDGTTTFNLPNLEDYVAAGVGGSLFGVTNNGIGKLGGSATHQIGSTELPSHTHALQVGAATGTGAASRALSGAGGAGVTGVNTTTNTAMTIVQQTVLSRKLIRFE